VPTAPTIHRIDAVARDPIALNSQLGHYTNFVNLLDWSALALPAGFRTDGLPFGCTLIGPAWCEAPLLTLGARWHDQLALRMGATSHAVPHSVPELPAQTVRIAVVGAHLTGMPLNHQLTDRHAALVTQTTTAPRYRLHALADTVPAKPGLQRVAANGGSAAGAVGGAGGGPIVVEVWDMPAAGFGSFVAAVPPPLAIGSVELADGSWVKGFVCEPHALINATDITAYGGWRSYMAAASSAAASSATPSFAAAPSLVASAPSATAACTASAAPTASS
jgi:allophanate hydrolase